MKDNELLPSLFRTEYSKVTAVLCKTFGIDNIELAEDIASDTFLQASETWGLKGLPENPKAWLYTVAKNKAKDYFKRDAIFRKNVLPAIANTEDEEELIIDLSEQNIKDSRLQMLFAVCHPCISQEAQIGLALRILCSFGITEIADAFLTGSETINKRLTRARKKLRDEKVAIEVPNEKEISQRLSTVLTTLYLLFNEGYYSQSNEFPLRKEMCIEAMRLANLLTENEKTKSPEIYALLALMSFHASRFEARFDAEGEIILYHDQDASLWDADLIRQGEHYLNLAAEGHKLSKFHLEAGIAFWHTFPEDTHEKWENILQLYNKLLMIEYSPITALNRTYALSKANSKEEAIAEAQKLNLEGNAFYHSLLGELYKGTDNTESEKNYRRALSLVKSAALKNLILKKLSRSGFLM